jgi:uncharacterized protein YcbK (DUF882 family)
MTFGTDVKSNINENIRSSLEENTGVVGQALKARREKMNRDKEVAAELSKIAPKTARLKSDNKSLKKIEISSIQISENFQLINKWAGAQATTHEETAAVMEEQKKVSQAALEEKLNVNIPDPKEDGSIFDSILDLFDKLGTKIKTKLPKVPKGKGGVLRKIAQFGARNIGTIAKVGVGAAALTYSSGLNTNEQEELDKRRNLPPKITPVPEQPPTQKPVDYSVPPPTGAVEANAKTAAAGPAIEAAKNAAAVESQPVIPTPPQRGRSPLPPPPPPAPTPVAAPIVAAGEPKKTLDVTKVAPATKPPEVAQQYAAGKQETTSSSAPSLTSVVKLQQPSVKLAGLTPEFEKRLTNMAADFKKQTGSTLQINSGFRSPEKQKQLYDEWIAGGKQGKVVARPGTSPHEAGNAADIQATRDEKGTGPIKGFLNELAGYVDSPSGWLEKYGLARPVTSARYGADKKEDWHVQLSGSAPVGDKGAVSSREGGVDPSTGKPLPAPIDSSTGKSLHDSSKTVAQLKQEQSQPGKTVVVVKNTTNITDYDKKKQPQGQTVAAVG